MVPYICLWIPRIGKGFPQAAWDERHDLQSFESSENVILTFTRHKKIPLALSSLWGFDLHGHLSGFVADSTVGTSRSFVGTSTLPFEFGDVREHFERTDVLYNWTGSKRGRPAWDKHKPWTLLAYTTIHQHSDRLGKRNISYHGCGQSSFGSWIFRFTN